MGMKRRGQKTKKQKTWKRKELNGWVENRRKGFLIYLLTCFSYWVFPLILWTTLICISTISLTVLRATSCASANKKNPLMKSGNQATAGTTFWTTKCTTRKQQGQTNDDCVIKLNMADVFMGIGHVHWDSTSRDRLTLDPPPRGLGWHEAYLWRPSFSNKGGGVLLSGLV